MGTGLQGHIGGRAPRPLAGEIKRPRLGMGATAIGRAGPGDDLAVPHKEAADRRVFGGTAETAAAKPQRDRHEIAVGRIARHRIGR